MKTIISVMLILSSVYLPGQALAELKDFSGQARAISDYAGKGKWTVAILWASDCHVCNVEAEQYIQFHEEYKDKHIEMLGISLDGQGKLEEAEKIVNDLKNEALFEEVFGPLGK